MEVKSNKYFILYLEINMSLKSGPGSKSGFSAGRLGSGTLLRDTAEQNLTSKNGKTGFGH